MKVKVFTVLLGMVAVGFAGYGSYQIAAGRTAEASQLDTENALDKDNGLGGGLRD